MPLDRDTVRMDGSPERLTSSNEPSCLHDPRPALKGSGWRAAETAHRGIAVRSVPGILG